MVPLQAGGIIVWRDRIVLRRTALGEWVLPKGWIDPGETPQQTALREVREETGTRVEVIRYIGSVPYQAEGQQRVVAYYLLRVLDGPEWSEHAGIDAGTFPVDEVRDTLTFENNRIVWDEAEEEVRKLLRRR